MHLFVSKDYDFQSIAHDTSDVERAIRKLILYGVNKNDIIYIGKI